MKLDLDAGMRLLEAGLDELGWPLDARRRAQFAAYIREIHLFNATYRLVGAEGDEFVTKHLLDSLAPLGILQSLISSFPAGSAICDVGSGAGLPGIPLAIMMPGMPFALVERSGRRCGFLRNALAICNLHDRVEVIERDLSEIDGRYALVTFRAFHPLADIIRPIGDILAEGGVVCAYKGRKEAVEEELAAVDALVREGKGGSEHGWIPSITPLTVPGLDASRTLCVLRKRQQQGRGT